MTHSIEYRTALLSDHWRILRQLVIEKQVGCCADCGVERWRFLQLHHLHYRTLGCERPGDVVAVCEQCHEKRDYERAHDLPHSVPAVVAFRRMVESGYPKEQLAALWITFLKAIR